MCASGPRVPASARPTTARRSQARTRRAFPRPAAGSAAALPRPAAGSAAALPTRRARQAAARRAVGSAGSQQAAARPYRHRDRRRCGRRRLVLRHRSRRRRDRRWRDRRLVLRLRSRGLRCGGRRRYVPGPPALVALVVPRSVDRETRRAGPEIVQSSALRRCWSDLVDPQSLRARGYPILTSARTRRPYRRPVPGLRGRRSGRP